MFVFSSLALSTLWLPLLCLVPQPETLSHNTLPFLNLFSREDQKLIDTEVCITGFLSFSAHQHRLERLLDSWALLPESLNSVGLVWILRIYISY